MVKTRGAMRLVKAMGLREGGMREKWMGTQKENPMEMISRESSADLKNEMSFLAQVKHSKL